MKIRITNPTGIPDNSDIFNADTGERIDGVTRVSLELSRDELKANIETLMVSVDMIAHLENVQMHDDYAVIKINKMTHHVEFGKEDDSSIEVIVRRK